jgi:hypothetical protein
MRWQLLTRGDAGDRLAAARACVRRGPRAARWQAALLKASLLSVATGAHRPAPSLLPPAAATPAPPLADSAATLAAIAKPARRGASELPEGSVGGRAAAATHPRR